MPHTARLSENFVLVHHSLHTKFESQTTRRLELARDILSRAGFVIMQTMKLIIITGPQAVGKMTVGHELEKITGLKLFHNHMTIELVISLFDYETPEAQKLIKLFRDEIFKTFASSDQEGLIFTVICNFDDPAEWERVKEVSNFFSSKGGKVCLVELEADTQVRIERNKTEHRLAHKPSKRDVVWSESNLLNSVENHRLNSREGEIKEESYLRIDNTNLSPEDVALQIKNRFDL
jgi:hypothetical protein